MTKPTRRTKAYLDTGIRGQQRQSSDTIRDEITRRQTEKEKKKMILCYDSTPLNHWLATEGQVNVKTTTTSTESGCAAQLGARIELYSNRKEHGARGQDVAGTTSMSWVDVVEREDDATMLHVSNRLRLSMRFYPSARPFSPRSNSGKDCLYPGRK